MRNILFILLFLFPKFLFAQESISEIEDSSIRSRIVAIRFKTDSFLIAKTSKEIKKKFNPNFGTTFLAGEFGINYQFLNKQKISPEEINNLNQYYFFYDSKIYYQDTLGIYYEDHPLLNIRFSSLADSVKSVALKDIYQNKLFTTITNFVKERKLLYPFLEIIVDKRSLKYSIILKDKIQPHKYYIKIS